MRSDLKSIDFEWIKEATTDAHIIYRGVCRFALEDGRKSTASHVFTMNKFDVSPDENRAEVKALKNAAGQIGLDIE